MHYFVLGSLCIFTIELLSKLNFFEKIKLIIKYSSKASSTIVNQNISDHWKEKTIPRYSLRIMQLSLKALLILLLIIFIFLLTDIYLDNFLNFAISITGVIESILVIFIYLKLKSIYLK